MKLWWCDSGGREGGRREREGGRREGHQFTGHSSLSVYVGGENEVLMLGLSLTSMKGNFTVHITHVPYREAMQGYMCLCCCRVKT